MNVPPLITVNPPKNAQFREEESIELPCHAVGIPTPTSVSLLYVTEEDVFYFSSTVVHQAAVD